jgi:cysteine desulfuration protein SufE
MTRAQDGGSGSDMSRFDEIAEAFASVDVQTRMQLLLDYARKLPAIPERLAAQRDAGLNRVHECQTPVYLWLEEEEGRLRIFVDVAAEAPTVAGILGILVRAYDGAPLAEAMTAPQDVLQRLGLAEAIRMNRVVGVSAMVGRIRHGAARLQQAATATRN